MKFPGENTKIPLDSPEDGDSWAREVWNSLKTVPGPFLFLGGEPPAFPCPVLHLSEGFLSPVFLPGDPWWSLLRQLGAGNWTAELTQALWPVPLISQALRFLTGIPGPEESPVEEEIPYLRRVLPGLMGELLSKLLKTRGPWVMDLGEGDDWGPLSREILGSLLERRDIPCVFLVRIRKSLDTQNLVDPRKIDAWRIRWQSGAFLIPEETESLPLKDPDAWLDYLEAGLAMGCSSEVLESAACPPPKVTKAQEIKLQLAKAQALLLEERTEEALSAAQISLSQADTLGDTDLREYSYIVLAKIFMKRGDGAGALRMTKAAQTLPPSTRSGMLSRRVVEFQVLHGTVNWKNNSARELEVQLLPLLQDLESAGWMQNWAFLASQTSLILHVNNESLTSGAEALLRKALVQAKSQRNNFRLARSYQALGIYLQERKEYSSARRAYLQSYRLRKILGGEAEIAGLETGLGYFHLSIGLYRESRYYLDRALDRLQDSSAYRETAAALYNLGVNAYFSGHGDEATEALHLGLELLNRAGIQHLPFTHRSDFHGVLGLSYLGEGKRATAWDQLLKARSLVPPSSALNLLLPLVLQGLLSQDDRGLEALRTRLLDNPEPQRHIYMDLLLRWAIKCQSRGDTRKAAALLEEGRTWLEGRDIFPWHREIFRGERPLETLEGSPGWPAFKLPDLKHALQLVDQDRHLRNLSRQYHLTRFLNGVHRLTNLPEAGFPLPGELLKHMFQYFPLKQAWLLFLPSQGERVFSTFAAQFLEDYSLGWDDLWHPDEWEGSGTGGWSDTPWRRCFSQEEKGFWVPLEGGQGGQGLLIGILNGDFVLDQEQLQALALGGHQVILSMELTKAWELLEQAAHKDSLTGLWNRRSLPAQFSTMVNRREPKQGSVLSLLYLDLDNFKDVNDIFGHGAGDRVLVWFSQALQSLIRAGDCAVRVGGDEFAVFLPGEGLDGAQSLASRILALFRELPPEISGLKFPGPQVLGCSVGIYSASVSKPGGLDHWLARADKALYQAKAQGKNCWAVYEGD